MTDNTDELIEQLEFIRDDVQKRYLDAVTMAPRKNSLAVMGFTSKQNKVLSQAITALEQGKRDAERVRELEVALRLCDIHFNATPAITHEDARENTAKRSIARSKTRQALKEG